MVTILTILAAWLVVSVAVGLVIGLALRRLGRGDPDDQTDGGIALRSQGNVASSTKRAGRPVLSFARSGKVPPDPAHRQ